MKYEYVPCNDDDEEFVEEKLTEINHSVFPPVEGAEEEEIVFKIEEENGNVIAGCLVEIDCWKIAELDIIWVHEQYRRQGLGSALIREAENAARKRGCQVIILGTFSFQARPLYEKHGYTLCGTVKDWPKGHENYSMIKRLDRTSAIYVPSRDNSEGFEIKPGSDEDAELIIQGLGDYNTSQAARAHKYIPLDRKLQDPDGNMIAAIIAGVSSWNVMEIDMIWVDERFRNNGIGSELLAKTESEAKKLGAYFSLAEGVFDWQDRFFRKNGYLESGVLDDVPKGHRMYVLEKRF